jgi:hypothetical protein
MNASASLPSHMKKPGTHRTRENPFSLVSAFNLRFLLLDPLPAHDLACDAEQRYAPGLFLRYRSTKVTMALDWNPLASSRSWSANGR